MKKTALLFALTAGTLFANAQLTLTGTSYSQNFNTISTGLPTGWSVYTGASTSSVGTIASFNSSALYGKIADTSVGTGCGAALVNNDGFKNYPSANLATTKTATCAQQEATTDRAMGVRQKSGTAPAYDPGAAFVLKLANTTGIKSLVATFKLQSLDTTTPRTASWTVDYGIGTAPTSFTDAAPTGTLTTGNFVFSNNSINVNFGAALDNKSSNVWIRIVTLNASTGTGTRPSTAIDDFNLTYTNTVGVTDVTAGQDLGLVAVGTASTTTASFVYSSNATGNYNFAIYDMTGRTLRTETVNADKNNGELTINNLNLAPGMYIAKMSNGNDASTIRFMVN